MIVAFDMTPTFDGCGANKSPTGEQQSFRLTTLMSTKARLPSPLIRLSRVVDTTQRYGERIRGQPRPSGLWFCDRRGEADYPVSSAKLLENTGFEANSKALSHLVGSYWHYDMMLMVFERIQKRANDDLWTTGAGHHSHPK